jgi:hypothetical protein
VKAHLTTEQTRAAVVSAWAEGLKTTAIEEQVIYAYRRDDVRALNELARQVRRATGELGEDHLVKVENGERTFAQGDRVFFGKNDRLLEVKNGTLGTVENLTGTVMTVRIDGDEKRRVQVDLRAYAHLDHGYASTVHKSQGATVDRTYVMASKLFDASTAYVSLSRQRDHVELHWAREEFGTRAELDRTLSRDRPKEFALEQLDDRNVTLKEALKDESRFALLSPARQRSLIGQYESALTKLQEKQPLLKSRDELPKHPALVAATAREAEATTAFMKTTQALADFREQQAQRWLPSMKSDRTLVDAEAKAKDAYWAARHAREHVERDPETQRAVAERIEKRNVPIVQHMARIKAWRAQVLEVEQRGLREHVLEQVETKLGHMLP